MPNFADLLNKPSGQAKKPPVLDAGDYPGVIKGHEMGESSQKKTPYVRFNLGLIGWPEGAEAQIKEDGTPIDLAGKSLRRDFFLTDDALWRLDQFLRDELGLELEGRSYAEVLPETTGSQVLIEVRQGMNQQTNDLFNEVAGLRKLA